MASSPLRNTPLVYCLRTFAESARGGYDYTIIGPAIVREVSEIVCHTKRDRAGALADIRLLLVQMHRKYYDVAQVGAKLPAPLLAEIDSNIADVANVELRRGPG